MKFLVLMDSFKGSMTSLEAAQAVEAGIKEVVDYAQIIKIPIADGGEGTVTTIVENLGGEYQQCWVTGPLGNPVKATFGILTDKRTAVIEMAAASGLGLISSQQRNPLLTTTYGTGELIRQALDLGCRHLIIGIGGSATNDGGVGMAQALGISFKDAEGKEVARGGGQLGRIATIDLTQKDVRLAQSKITVICDVLNPLWGEQGAAAVYGPQKGADPVMVEILDRGLKHLDSIITQQLGFKVGQIPGSGAAGGLGAGLLAFCGAELKAGITTVLNLIQFEELIKGVDLIITGEGRIDGQSCFGKVPYGIAVRAAAQQVPVIAIVGSMGEQLESLYASGVQAIFSIINEPMTLAEAMSYEQARRLLTQTVANVLRVYLMNRG